MNIYFLSGLGADKRAFEKLNLPDSFSLHHILWITPSQNETIESYAKRLANQIDISSTFCLVGLSFGGIMAVELSKFLAPKKTIIISSVANSKQLPWHYKFLGKLKVYDFLPLKLMKKTNRITNWFFGTEDQEEQKILGEIIHETDSDYLKWALKMISTWKSKHKISNLVHIHGNHDRLFPIKHIQPTIVIDKGAHLMIREHADVISEHLRTILLRVV